MPNERFNFLKSYADSLNELAKADEQLAKDLAWKIIQYGIYGTNETSGSPIIEALFLQMKLAIDKGNDISEKRRNANQQRTNIQQNLTNSEQNLTKINKQGTNGEQNAPKYKKENIKDKKENILSLSKDNEVDKSTKEYGNADINKCLELIKTYNNGIVDGTKVNQRRYANHLINKLKELDSIKDGKYTREETLEIILKIISKNKYHSGKITSPEAIYRNLGLLMNVCKNDITKATADNIILETL